MIPKQAIYRLDEGNCMSYTVLRASWWKVLNIISHAVEALLTNCDENNLYSSKRVKQVEHEYTYFKQDPWITIIEYLFSGKVIEWKWSNN